jgi:hypothetical protein
MKQQGAWRRWDNGVDRKVTWAELWRAEVTALNSSSRQYMMCFQAHQTCTHGAWPRHQHARCVPSETLEHILSCCVGEAVLTLQENHRLCQSWGAVNPCRKNMCGNPNICTLQMLGLQSPPCDQTLSLCLSPASKLCCWS